MMSSNQLYLLDCWDSIFSNYSQVNFEIAHAYGIEIIANYSEHTRHYHNVDHINSMLKLCDLYQRQLKNIDNVKIAVFYHDCIYNSKSNTNETDSAKRAVEELTQINFPAAEIEKIKLYILSTQNHKPLLDDSDLKYFLDFDLYILGQTENQYFDYTKRIRREYQWVPSFIYNTKRKAVLKSFLERNELYYTTEFVEKYTQQAKINLEEEIKSLS